MGADLYETLGVDRTASREEIARAGRRKAREVHPDKGGSEAAWHALSLAREVLGDEATRAHYDETGEIPKRGPSIEDEARSMLMAGFVSILQSGPEMLEIDVAEWLRKGMKGLRRKGQDAIRNQNQVIALMESQMGRLSGAESVFFESYLSTQIAEARRQIALETRGLEVAEKAAEMIADLKDLKAVPEPDLSRPTITAQDIDNLMRRRKQNRKEGGYPW
jgi:curved DNA-binding protein CbpA